MAKSYWHIDDSPLEQPRSQSGNVKIQELEAALEKFSSRKQLPKACKYYKKYQGIMPPKCSGGSGCQVCWLIYEVKNEIE